MLNPSSIYLLRENSGIRPMKRGKQLMINYKFLGILLVFILETGHVDAQKAVASIDTTSIRLGEQVQLKLDVTLPRAARVNWPDLKDTIFGPVEIISRSRVDTIETSRDNYLQYKQNFTITSFDTGYHTIPQIAVKYQLPGDKVPQIALTDSLLLHVRTVDVDTTLAIKDIKALMPAPITLSELWPVFAVLAVLGSIIGFIWYYLWRKRMKKPLFPVLKKPELPPWMAALQSLDEIAAKKLWQIGKTKEYHTLVTDVLRTYIEKQYKIQAMEMISSEILESLDNKGLEKNTIVKARHVLELADLVKFAKENPLPPENEQSLSYTKEFVIETKPTEEKERTAEKPENQETTVYP
jgi:hypothetical protein